MMYLAPRQGLFAIIILVSFCLQTLLLVISTDQQLSESRTLKGEQMVAQLIDEARLSLENQDRVSLSVIANRYTSEQDVARIVIKDNKGELLVPVGNAPMQQGDIIRQDATNGEAVIGQVELTLKDVSKGEIITMQWPFIIGSMLLHLFLWLLYGYIARPTKAQINALSHDIEDVHRERYLQSGQQGHSRRSVLGGSKEDDAAGEYGETTDRSKQTNVRQSTDKSSTISTSRIHDDLNAYVKSQQDQSADASTETALAIDGSEGYPQAVDNSAYDSADNTNKPAKTLSKLSATRDFDRVNVQIAFHDQYHMLERLAPEMRLPYLALCTQLLNQAVTELLKQPLLMGVSSVNQPRFAEKGAYVILQADNSHAKVALAGVMLGKLYLMLNKIIHNKHIELSRFALPAKVGVSDDAQSDAIQQLLDTVGKKEEMLLLLPHAGLKQISGYAQVQPLARPTTVYERECTLFDGGNEAMMQRLADARNAVLMMGSVAE